MTVDVKYLRDLCFSIPTCIGWSNTKNRLYLVKPYPLPRGIEAVITNPFRTHLMMGLPIGGYVNQGQVVLGTISFFATDGKNYYMITDSHVVSQYDVVYYPSPIVLYQPSLIGIKLQYPPPTPIGTVVWRSNINQQFVNLDMAIIKLNPGVTPYPIAYGGNTFVFFDIVHEAEPVTKVGARTGITSGITIDKSATLNVTTDTGENIYFTGPVFALHSEAGDSGSPIFAGTSLVSTLVAGNGAFVIGNEPSIIISTLKSFGLKAVVVPKYPLLYIPPIITGLGSILAGIMSILF